MTRPQIVFIATRAPYPPVTGYFVRSYNILRGLSRYYDVHFFGFYPFKLPTDAESRTVAGLKEICSSVHVERVRSEHNHLELVRDTALSFLLRRPFVSEKYFSRTLLHAVTDCINRVRPSIAIADVLPASRYLLNMRGPTLLVNHNVEHARLRMLARQDRYWLRRAALSIQSSLTTRYEREVLTHVGNFVAVSGDDLRELLALSPTARGHLVPNGADGSLGPLPASTVKTPTILWVGGMDDKYNRAAVEYFAEAIFPESKRRVPELRWLVVGRDPPASLRKLASRYAGHIEIAGFVSELRDVYQRAHVVVVPLTAGGGTKLKVLEGMAYGRAVLTTPVGAEGIAANDGVELAVAHSTGDYIRRLCELLSDGSQRDSIGIAANALIRTTYDWKVIDAAMLEVIEAVCDRHGRRYVEAAGPV